MTEPGGRFFPGPVLQGRDFKDLTFGPPFGLHSQGLVTVLTYPPDDLVLVVQIQWIGD